MRISFLLLCVVVTVSAFSVGCGSTSSDTPTKKVTGTSNAGHDDGDHSEGDHAGHDHPTEGLHGGHLIELGNEEYHAELLHDENTHAVTIHLLDGPGKQPVTIPQTEITLQLFRGGEFVKYILKAIPGEGEPAGAASRFEIVDNDLCDALCDEDSIRGRLQVTINGKQFTGDIKQSSHEGADHEEHDHAGHEH